MTLKSSHLNQFIVVLLCALLIMSPMTTHATTAITNTLCIAINQMTGNIGKAIAVIIILSLAMMLFLGKVTWGVAIALAVGMGILFGARDVVDLLAGGGAKICQ